MTEVRFLGGARYFSSIHAVQTGSGTHSASYPMGTVGVSPGIKRQGRDSDDSPPSRREVKNVWSCTSTSPNIHSWRDSTNNSILILLGF
jgi:hypothetical protein